MKNIIQSFLLLVLSCLSVSVKAQWFNDDMGSVNVGAAPCPWVNTTPACNPAGVSNQGVCVTGSLGGPMWRGGATTGVASYTWEATSAGNTACTFTYTLNVTGTATITSIAFQARRNTDGAPNISISINGTSKTPSPVSLTTTSFTAVSVPVSPSITVSNGTITIVIGFTGANAVASGWINRIDDFQISGTAAPVEMTRFDAKSTPSGVRLLWATATEHNNDYFAVEHSTDGQQFAEIAQVKGAGNVAVQQQYEYTDAKPAKGMNYYRLRQVDYGGRFDYSSVQSVKISSHSTTMLAPNPLQEGNNAILHYDSDNEADLNINVFNHLGQLILSRQTGVEKGANNLPLDLSQLPKGVYALRLQTGTSLPDTKQVVVE